MTILSAGLGIILLLDGVRKLFGGATSPWIGIGGMILAIVLVVIGRFILPRGKK